jgi:hypothetical protein
MVLTTCSRCRKGRQRPMSASIERADRPARGVGCHGDEGSQRRENVVGSSRSSSRSITVAYTASAYADVDAASVARLLPLVFRGRQCASCTCMRALYSHCQLLSPSSSSPPTPSLSTRLKEKRQKKEKEVAKKEEEEAGRTRSAWRLLLCCGLLAAVAIGLLILLLIIFLLLRSYNIVNLEPPTFWRMVLQMERLLCL